MKALVWNGPKKMNYMDVPYPKVKPDWVIIRVETVGICGSELSGYLGENSLRVPPLIMGHEFSGIVVEVGENVSKDNIGKLVTVNPLLSCGKCRACLSGDQQLCIERKIIGINHPGAFAEYVCVPAKQCHNVTNKYIGALVEPLACSLRAVNKAGIEVGDVGVVIGAGIIGLLSMKLMKLRGASSVIALDTNEARLQESRDWGATHLCNPKEMDAFEKIKHSFPTGVDKVIDAVGYSKTRKQSIDLLRRGGRAIFIGLHEDETTFAGNDVVRNEIEVAGTFCYSEDDFSKAVSLIEEGFIEKNDGHWYEIRPLGNGDDAFQEQISGDARYSKILLTPN